MRCPYCDREVSGRTDKVFCDDQCRNNYYYRINSERKTYIRNINKKLLKNHGILKTLNPAGKKYVFKKTLDDLGFDFNCFTGVYTTKKGKEYRLVYDQAFCLEDDDRVCLLLFYRDAESVVS